MNHPKEEFIGINLLELAIEYGNSDYFRNKVSNFLIEKSNELEYELYELKEYSLSLTQVFREYQDLIDSLFENFAYSNNVSIAQVYQSFKDSVEGKFTPLFEENENKWFVDKVVGWMDFENFVKLLRKSSRKNFK